MKSRQRFLIIALLALVFMFSVTAESVSAISVIKETDPCPNYNKEICVDGIIYDCDNTELDITSGGISDKKVLTKFFVCDVPSQIYTIIDYANSAKGTGNAMKGVTEVSFKADNVCSEVLADDFLDNIEVYSNEE